MCPDPQGALRHAAAGLIQVNVCDPATEFDLPVAKQGRFVMPTIDIIMLAIIVGGAVAFMAEMIWFSMDRNKMSRK